MRSRRWIALAGFLAASFAAAAVGGFTLAASVKTWYPGLAKPAWTPPGRVFGPVWLLLYTLMAVAAWRVWRQRDQPGVRAALVGFFVQLGLNAAWPGLFFGLRNPGAAFAEIGVLWVLLAWLQARFWRLDRPAGLLWLPYLAWTTFALGLNFAIWRLNP
jgi:tryptophan-rich sensory protein